MRVAGVVVLVALLGGLVGCGSDDVEVEAPTTTEPPTTTAEPWPLEHRENFLEACVESFLGIPIVQIDRSTGDPIIEEELDDDLSIQAAGELCLCVLTNLKATMSIDEYIVLELTVEEGVASIEDAPAAFVDAVEGCF